MAITQIDIPKQKRMLTGMDWRSVQGYGKDADKIIMIDMTVERRNKLGNSQDWRYINIPTPDFSTPDWTAQQWLDLAAFVYSETDPDSRKRSSVFVACQGGQGRTGIALAILRAVLTEDFIAPVKAIRAFNPHFIETPGQEAYVKRIVKEIERLTEPAVVIEPIDWSARAGKAEKRVAELEAEVKRLMRDNTVLMDERDEYRDRVYAEQNKAEDRIAKKLHDALGIVFEDR